MEKARKAKSAFELDVGELDKVTGGNNSGVPEKRKGRKSVNNHAVLSALSTKVKNVSMYTPESDD